MRIKQLYCEFGQKSPTGFEGFRAVAAKTFDMQIAPHGYINPSEPLLMIGCYNHRQATVAINHANFSTVVIYWCGSDSSVIRNDSTGFWANLLRINPNIKHIAPSHWIADDLDAMGLPYIKLPVLLQKHEDIKPEPLGDCVYVYQPEKANYGSELYKRIKPEIPFKIIETTSHTFNREQLLEAYRNSFIGLRFTEHDGLAETVCELGLMGRRVLHNGDTPNSIHYDKNDIDSIIEIIEREFYCKENYRRVSAEMCHYIHTDDDWLNTEFYD